MRYCQLTIDLTEDLLTAGFVQSGRARKFALKALSTEPRIFTTDSGQELRVASVEGGVSLEVHDVHLLEVESSDRLVLRAGVGVTEPGRLEIVDGAQAFVKHVFDRADAVTKSWLLGQGYSDVARAQAKHYWRSLRDELLRHLISREVRGPVAVAAFVQHLQRRGVELEFMAGREEPVPAEAVLRAFYDAHGSPKRKRSSGGGLGSDALLRMTEASPSGYGDAASLGRLVNLLHGVEAVFGADAVPEAAEGLRETLLRVVRETGRGLPRLSGRGAL